MGPIGWPEILIIVLIAFLIFGPKRLPELAKSVGQGIREFKKSVSEATDEAKKAIDEEAKPDAKPPAS